MGKLHVVLDELTFVKKMIVTVRFATIASSVCHHACCERQTLETCGRVVRLGSFLGLFN